MLSALVGFAIARRLGRETVAEHDRPAPGRVEDVMRHQGVAAVVVARLTPVLPFTIVNYGAGVSAVSLRDYLVGTAVGIVPGTVGYAAARRLGGAAPPRRARSCSASCCSSARSSSGDGWRASQRVSRHRMPRRERAAQASR